MDTVVKIDYSNYSIEELVKVRAELNDLIDQKRAQAYEMGVSKVIDALEEMAENYPYDDAFDYEGEVIWKELYDMVRNHHV